MLQAINRSRTYYMIAMLTSVAVSACSGNGEGLDVNGRPPGEGGAPSSGDFAQIQDTIFTPICTACHAGGGAPQGLRLDAGNSFALLVNVPSAEVPSVLRVAPGDPDNSYLVQKIEGRAAVGARMPLGGAPLPQSSIDLVRQWIAAGAQPPTSSATSLTSLRVVATIPAADEQTIAPVPEMLVVFSGEIDPSLVSAATVALTASGGDGRFDDGNEYVVSLKSVHVPLGRPSVMVVRPAEPLSNDTYELLVNGTGAVALADNDARVLDGNADGQPGGDFTMTFQMGSGDAR